MARELCSYKNEYFNMEMRSYSNSSSIAPMQQYRCIITTDSGFNAKISVFKIHKNLSYEKLQKGIIGRLKGNLNGFWISPNVYMRSIRRDSIYSLDRRNRLTTTTLSLKMKTRLDRNRKEKISMYKKRIWG